jgi:tRNA threonylcarbamoyladenosine biosynthesis protein TsaE
VTDREFKIISKSVDQTIELGRILGQSLIGGEIIALTGTLGTGKTHFIKGLALGLDIEDATAITSPTFTLINECQGRLPLNHIDAYRLENAEQLEMLGFDELSADYAVTVVEWADRVWPLVGAYRPIRINLEHRGETTRDIQMENLPDHVHKKLLSFYPAFPT